MIVTLFRTALGGPFIVVSNLYEHLYFEWSASAAFYFPPIPAMSQSRERFHLCADAGQRYLSAVCRAQFALKL